MDNVRRIRELISAGKSDADIVAALRAARDDDDDLGWSNPNRMLRGLAATMRRAVNDDRAVGAHEVVKLLELFRTLWEEVVANDDVAKVNEVALRILGDVTSADSVGKAYVQLHDDMTALARPLRQLDEKGREARARVETRYLREVAGNPVICPARVGLAVADLSEAIFRLLDDDSRYRHILTADVLRPCLELTIVHRPRWVELLGDASSLESPSPR